jgi:excisionase family DNA binding protein
MPTTSEAASVLGLTRRSVSRLIKSGLLQAEKHGRDYLIPQTEIDRYQRKRQPSGRPRHGAIPNPPIEDVQTWHLDKTIPVMVLHRSNDLIGDVVGIEYGRRYTNEDVYFATARIRPEFGKTDEYSIQNISGTSISIAQLAKLANVEAIILEDAEGVPFTDRDASELTTMLEYFGHPVPIYQR